MKKTYKIKITPLNSQEFCALKPYEIEIETDDIDWSMEQYQRNRAPFKWEIVNK